MTLRVIQWATGGLGQAAIGQIQLHPDLELVGCWVHSEGKAGQDAGELAGIGPIGVTATNSLDEILAMDADCVLYSPLMPNPKEVAAILRSGKNVVTPLGWFWPTAEEKARMEVPALEGGVTLHGTGIDPGGATEQQPLFFAGLSSAITFVRGEEYSDIRTYNAPDVVRHIMGFGQSPEDAMNGPMLALLDNGFDQSVRMCLDTLGFAEAEIRSSREVAVATAPIDSPIGEIQPGQVAAQRFAWEAFVGDAKVVRVAVNWLMGDEHLDPPWKYGEGGVRFEVEVKGDPDCHVTIHGWHPTSVAAGLERNPGIVVTAAHCVNSIPYVCAAQPGLLTFVDMPLVTGRATPTWHAELMDVSRWPTLDPEFHEIVEMLPETASAFDDIPAARAMFDSFLPSGPVAGEAELDITDVASDGVDLRIYRPKGVSGDLPGILYLHGGGFCIGSIDTEHAGAVILANAVQAVVVNVEYRLAPEHAYPAGLEDCYTGLKYLAGLDGVDVSRLAVHGQSAGGGLAAATALLARDRGGPRLAFQSLGIPELDDRLETPSMTAYTDTPMWSRVQALKSWEYYLGGQPADAYAAPARMQDLTGLPAAYVVTCELDPLRDEGITYAMRMLAAGVSVELHTYPGTFHGAQRVQGAGVVKRMDADLLGALSRALNP